MKTSKLNIKKILSIFVLLLVCCSAFMLVGCAGEGEKLEVTSTASTHVFNYKKVWNPSDANYVGFEQAEEEYEAELTKFYKTIMVTYTAPTDGSAGANETSPTTGNEQGFIYFKNRGASISNLTLTVAGTRTMRITYKGVTSDPVQYTVSVA